MKPSETMIQSRINHGPFLVHYTLPEAEKLIRQHTPVLPICSFGTPQSELAKLGGAVLPPLYHDALDETLKQDMLQRIHACFPYYETSRKRKACDVKLEVVELPRRQYDPPARDPKVLAFSFDTAVEEHGPHLPLNCDTIQSYHFIELLAGEIEELIVGPAAEYGQLTWGLPVGFSVELTGPVLKRYVVNYLHALKRWINPRAILLVDTHGGKIHREVLATCVKEELGTRGTFRWLYDNTQQFRGQPGDAHAGGGETTMLNHINPALVDARFWPAKVDELAAHEMRLERVLELSQNIPNWVDLGEREGWNGIVGGTMNYKNIDVKALATSMLEQMRSDVHALMNA